MTWKRFFEILLKGPKAARIDRPKAVTFSNLGRGRTLGEDIKSHYEVAPCYDFKTDQWNDHVFCPTCGVHAQYLHNLRWGTKFPLTL